MLYIFCVTLITSEEKSPHENSLAINERINVTVSNVIHPPDTGKDTKVLHCVLRGPKTKQFDVLLDLGQMGVLAPKIVVGVSGHRFDALGLASKSFNGALEQRQALYFQQLSESYRKDPKAILGLLYPLYEVLVSGRKVGVVIASQKDRWKFHGFQSFWTVVHDVVRDTRPL